MRLPRDLSGPELIRALSRLGYVQTRQSGSHVRLTRSTTEGDHHITVPQHSPLRVGTLNKILTDVATHLGLTRDQLIELL